MQGIKFKLQTKVTGVEKQKDGSVKVSVHDMKSDKTEIVSPNAPPLLLLDVDLSS